MAARRYSVAQVLRAVRAARTSAALAEVRYAKLATVALLIRAAMLRLNQAERALMTARSAVAMRHHQKAQRAA